MKWILHFVFQPVSRAVTPLSTTSKVWVTPSFLLCIAFDCNFNLHTGIFKYATFCYFPLCRYFRLKTVKQRQLKCLFTTVKVPGGSVMVKAAFSLHSITHIQIVERDSDCRKTFLCWTELSNMNTICLHPQSMKMTRMIWWDDIYCCISPDHIQQPNNYETLLKRHMAMFLLQWPDALAVDG